MSKKANKNQENQTPKLKISKNGSFIKRIKEKIFRPYEFEQHKNKQQLQYDSFMEFMNKPSEETYSRGFVRSGELETIDGPFGSLFKSSKERPMLEAASQFGVVVVPADLKDITYEGLIKMYDNNIYYINIDIETTIKNEMSNPERLRAKGYLINDEGQIKNFEENADIILNDEHSITRYVTDYFNSKKANCLNQQSEVEESQKD